MELFYLVKYKKIFSPNFGQVSQPFTSLFKMPSKTDVGQFLKKHFLCDVIICDYHKAFKSEFDY